MGKTWWSRRTCPNDGSIMSTEHSKKKEGYYTLTCESCWLELESEYPYGVKPLAGQEEQ